MNISTVFSQTFCSLDPRLFPPRNKSSSFEWNEGGQTVNHNFSLETSFLQQMMMAIHLGPCKLYLLNSMESFG